MVLGLKLLKARTAISVVLAAGSALAAVPAAAQERFITMASTTSTEQSGLFAHLRPAFKAATGIEVRGVAVGTGQALDMGRRGDADILLDQSLGNLDMRLARHTATGHGIHRDASFELRTDTSW